MSAINEMRKLRSVTKPAAVKFRSMIRRFIVTAAEKALWQVANTSDAKDESETDVEVFSGIGFYSRPKLDSDPEVILVKVGGKTAHPVIVATRDETVRAAVADISEDETIIFNSTGSRVIIKADGEIHIDDGSGAVALATKADVQGVIDAMASGVPSAGDGGAAIQTAFATFISTGGFPAGTSVLKGK